MKNVTVRKEELLAILKTNRDNHRAIFESAQEGYRQAWIDLLEDRLEDARLGRKIERTIWLNPPVDQTADYDRAIKMVEMHTGGTIDLDEKRFANYVMDDWEWSENFKLSNSAYTTIS